MKIRIIFQNITDEAKAAGYDHHAPLLAFVEVNDYDTGKSLKIGEWSADGEYEALDIEVSNVESSGGKFQLGPTGGQDE